MSDQALDKVLEEAQFALFGGASLELVGTSMKQLAQAQYAPAIPFFVSCLRDKRQDWRAQSLMLLGTFYDLAGNEMGLEGLRGVLRQDGDPQLRRKAADFLSLHASWPEQSLIDALNSDPDVDVRYAALQAILELTGIPRMTIRDEIGTLRASQVLPSMSDVQRITEAGRGSRDFRF